MILQTISELCEDRSVLELCGLASLAYIAGSFARHYVWTPFKLYAIAQMLPGVDLNKHGEWAVVTGATDGIGRYIFVDSTKDYTLTLKTKLRKEQSRSVSNILGCQKFTYK